MKRKLTGFLGRAFSYPEYAKAFKSAGDLLAGYMAIPGGREPLVLPAIYLYRHYVELMVKVLTYMEADLSEGNASSNKPKVEHDIEKLWIKLEPRIRARLPEYASEISEVKNCISKLSGIDASGYKLRYPEDTGGHEVSFTTDDVDVIGLREAVSKAAESFDSIHSALSDIQHERWDEMQIDQDEGS